MTLTQLEEYFNSATIPQTLQLSEAEFIKDVPKMIATHISFLKGNAGNKTFLPYFNRPLKIYNLLKTKAL